MKRRFLCRVTSFALAAILAAESSMTAAAAQNGVSQGTLTVETEETIEEAEGDTASGTKEETISETAGQGSGSETAEDTEAETASESGEEQETASESTGETETASESVEETEAETETASESAEETETETASESAEETEMETASESAEETETETASESVEETETASEAAEGTEQETDSEEETKEDEAAAPSTAKENEAKEGETEQSTANVEKVSLNKTEMTLRLNTVGILEAVVEPTGAEQVVWTSSAPEIASVDNGKVRALKGGKAVITATAGGKSAECEVTVTVPVNKIELEKTSLEIVRGGNSKEVVVNILPLEATNRVITAVTEDETLATCSTADGKLILTSGTKLGKTTVKITVDEMSTVLDVNIVEEEEVTDDTSTMVSVRKISFGLTEAERTIELDTGNTYQLTATVLPENATNKILTWSSSDESVAVVSDAGLITATGKGMAQITAKAENGVYDKVTVIATNEVDEVKINGIATTLYCNGDNPIFAEKTLHSTYNIEMTDTGLECIFRSSDETVATVDEKGHVTAVAPGTAQIIAVHQASGKSDAITITVKRLIEEVKLPVSETTVVVGTKMKLTAETVPEEVTTEKLEWTVKDASPKGCLIYDEENQVFVADGDGTATIVASAADEGKGTVKDQLKVTIKSDISATAKLTLTYKNKSSVSLKSGAAAALVTKVWDKSGNDKILNDTANASTTIAYKSSDEKVAVVDAKGNVTAVAGGTAVITATAMDGSNVSGKCKVTVEQRPEEITFSREEYVVVPAGSVKLSATVLPETTKNKKVSWEITEVSVPDGVSLTEYQKKMYVTVNSSGTVKAMGAAPEGMTVKVRCTSSAFEKTETPVSKEVTVRVKKSKITSLKMKKSSLELNGLGTQAQLEFMVKGADAATAYTWASNDEEVIAVDANGVVTVKGYGTAKVTVCADNVREAACTIAAYPVKKGQSIAATSGNYGIQQIQNDGNASVQLYFVNKSTKAALDAGLFTFTSSNPEIVYVDEKGMAYANPKTQITEDTEVTITAALKDDPLKRKATTKVTVWKDAQVKNIEFQYMESGKTKFEAITDHVEEIYKEGSKFKIKAKACDADNKAMSGKKLSFSISDPDMADISLEEATNTLTVTVKQAGKFKITCTANDKMHVSRQVEFGMYSGTPILKADSLGTINKTGAVVSGAELGTDKSGVLSDTVFAMAGANGSEISEIAVESVKIEQENGTYSTAGLGFTKRDLKVIAKGNMQYQLAMDSEVLAQSTTPTGTYEIVLSVKRTDMEIEDSFSDVGDSEKVTTTFKITDSKPSVKIPNVTVNSFERGTWTKLNISTKEEIESIAIAAGDELANYYEVMERQDGWYIAIREEKFDDCASKKIQGRFSVELKGYEKPVQISVTVTAKATKPSLKQVTVPDVLVSQGNTAQIAIYNNTAKENLTDYQVSLKTKENLKWNIVNEKVSDKLEARLTDSACSVTKTKSYKQKIVVTKDGWRTPVEMNVTVKASAKSVKPSVTFEKKSITLNKNTASDSCTFAVSCNKANLELKTGEWEFVNSSYNELFTAEYQDGKLTIGLKPEAVKNGKVSASSYKLEFVDVFEGTSDYETVKTAAVKVSVNSKQPAVKVKVSGKMDLLSRKASTLTATVTVSGVSSGITDISLMNGEDTEFTKNFYSVQEENKVIIYARSTAELEAGQPYKGKVKVTLENGTVLQQDISFKLTESVPGLKTIPVQTVYKAEADRVMDFNLNEAIPEGIQIKEVVTKALPAGLGVEYDNGHAYVVLNDDAVKTGQYTIQADVYFKGAQKTTDSENGKPVRISLNVQVKEQ